VGDIDFKKRTISLNRGLSPSATSCTRPVARPATPAVPSTSTRPPLSVLAGWKALQAAELVAIDDDGWVFTDARPIHPHALSQVFERIARRAGVPVIRLHDLRHTHGTLLIKEGVPVKVVSERLGHANIAFTIQTYQHVLPGMQADAARTYELLTHPCSTGGRGPGGPPEEDQLSPVDDHGNNEPRSLTWASCVNWWRGQDLNLRPSGYESFEPRPAGDER